MNRDDPLSAEGLAALAHQYRAVTWPDLLQHRRLLVLAEAGSGKTEEFRERAALLQRDGQDAFFAAIEQVADFGLTKTLGRARAEKFDEWHRSSRPCWLFLDSVDEAKLQRRSLAAALSNVAEALGEAARRAHILISCRGTDWDPVRDLAVVQDQLPPLPDTETVVDPDPDEVLLSVLDRGRHDGEAQSVTQPQIVVFSLTKLSRAQQRAFLVDRKVDDTDAFEQAVRLRGLEPLSAGIRCW